VPAVSSDLRGASFLIASSASVRIRKTSWAGRSRTSSASGKVMVPVSVVVPLNETVPTGTPPSAGLSFHSGTSRLGFPDSFVPISAVTTDVSIQPLSLRERKSRIWNDFSFIMAVGAWETGKLARECAVNLGELRTITEVGHSLCSTAHKILWASHRERILSEGYQDAATTGWVAIEP
jgi:hypothetical protein